MELLVSCAIRQHCNMALRNTSNRIKPMNTVKSKCMNSAKALLATNMHECIMSSFFTSSISILYKTNIRVHLVIYPHPSRHEMQVILQRISCSPEHPRRNDRYCQFVIEGQRVHFSNQVYNVHLMLEKLLKDVKHCMNR